MEEQKSSDILATKRSKAQQRVVTLETELGKLGFSASEFQESRDRQEALIAEISDYKDRASTLEAQLQARLEFSYKDPVRGFDRSKVKGLVAKLVQVYDSVHATALEVVAGGKLFQVVVDEATTGKALLQRGKLARRVTIIPLDKIKSRTVSIDATKKAGSIATNLNTYARPAIELLGFEEDVRGAIEYVFGSSIIVDGVKAANEVCDKTKVRTVTLEGDTYEPSGTISGGSKKQIGTTLSNLALLADLSKQIEEKEQELASIEVHLSGGLEMSGNHDAIRSKLELARAELETQEKLFGQSKFGRFAVRRDNLKKELAHAETECNALEQEALAKGNLHQELKESEMELTLKREARLEDVEKAVETAKEKVAEFDQMLREVCCFGYYWSSCCLPGMLTVVMQQASSSLRTGELEIESEKAELLAGQDALNLAEGKLEEARRVEQDFQISLGTAEAEYEASRSRLENLEKEHALCSEEISELKRKKEGITSQLESKVLSAKKIEHSLSRLDEEQQAAVGELNKLVANHTWIEEEKESFGATGSDYDFSNTNSSTVSGQLKALQAEQAVLVRKMYFHFFVSHCSNILLFSVKDDQQESNGDDREG